MLQYQLSHCQFTTRFKSIRRQENQYLGQCILLKDTKTKQRAIAQIYTFTTQQQLQIIFSKTQPLIQIINNKQYISNHKKINENNNIISSKYFCKFLAYTINSNQYQQQLYLVYQYHCFTLEESIRSKILHHGKFTEIDIFKFITTILSNLTYLEDNYHQILKDYPLSIKTQGILVDGLDSIECCFKCLYSSNIKQTGYTYLTNIDDHINQNICQEQLKQSQKINKTYLKQYKQKIGLLALRMLEPQNYKIYIKDQQTIKIDHNQISNILKLINNNNNNGFNKQKYSKNIVNIIQLLIYQEECLDFKQLYQVVIGAKDQFRNSRVNYSAKSRKSIDKQYQSNQKNKNIKKVKWDTRSNSNTNSPREKVYMTKLQVEEKILLNSNGQPYPNISQKIYSDGAKYVGQFLKDNRHGRGIYYYAQGDLYGGQWRDNSLQGYGIYLFSNGQIYEGSIHQGLKHGVGTYIYTNNNKYIGEWKNDKKDGNGVYQYKHRGDIYEGGFKQGLKHGYGVYKWADGSRYQGEFQNGLKHGVGQGFTANGTKISGTWVNDNLQGVIQVKYKRGDQMTVQFRQNNLNGEGIYRYIQGTFYQGQFKHGKKNGNCTIEYPNGDKYIGEIKNGKFQGRGIYQYQNQGIIYQGQWSRGLQHGKGILKFRTGTIIEMEWKLGKPSQSGKIYYPNQDTYEGCINSMGRNGIGTYFMKDGRQINGKWSDGALIY